MLFLAGRITPALREAAGLSTPDHNNDRVAGLNINPGGDDSDEEDDIEILQGEASRPPSSNIDRALQQITNQLESINFDSASEEGFQIMKGCVVFEADDPDDSQKKPQVACFFSILASGVKLDSVEIVRTNTSITFKGCIPYGLASTLIGNELSSITSFQSSFQSFLDEQLRKTQSSKGFTGIPQNAEITIPKDLKLETGFVDPFTLRPTHDPLDWHVIDSLDDKQSDVWTVFCFALVLPEHESGAPVREERTR